MINALNLKLQVLITSFRLLKKPTQTYFLECKMLLIKYFSNTKAMCFGTQESVRRGHHHADIHCRQWTLSTTASSGQMRRAACARGLPLGSHLYRLMVGLWYMHM